MKHPATFDPEAPLDRIPHESKRANRALIDYARMGEGRSLIKLLKSYLRQNSNIPPVTTKKTTIETWSVRYFWQVRVAAWDALQKLEADQEWKTRRDEVRQADYKDAEKLRKLAQDILDQTPNFIKSQRKTIKGAQGQPDTIIVTMALNVSLAVDAMELASQLQRKASGLDSKTPVLTNLNLESLTTHQLRRLAAGDDILEILADPGNEDDDESDPIPALPSGD